MGASQDLIILDINLPEMDGLDVCREVRKTSDVPILFLSSRDEEIDRIIGLEIGGDDYVSKPFSPRELVARTKVILKRTRGGEPATDDEALTAGRVTLWPDQHRAGYTGSDVALTATEFRILKAFLARPHFVRDRQGLIDVAYGPGIHVSDRTIDSHIRHIRAKFEAAGCDGVIETVHGVGYKLGSCAQPPPMTSRAIARKYRPSVAAVLIAVTMLILLLPLASILFFRIYENQLVRETETELIAQAAVLGAAYKQALRRALPDHDAHGTPVVPPAPATVEGDYAPVLPQIDLPADPVLPRRPRARVSSTPSDPALLAVGAEMTALFVDAQRATLAGMRLLDHRGVVIGGRSEIGLSLAHVAEVRDALAGFYRSAVRERISDEPAPPITSISRGTGIRIFVAFPVIDDERLRGVVYMSRTPKSILQHMYDSRYRLVGVGVLVVTLTVFVAWMTSRTLLRPIRQLSIQARELADGRRQTIEPLEHYGTRELATLGQSFADMAAALERRNRYMRDFASHVSHEFKTPLTAIRGAAELLTEHHDTMDEAERRRFLANIDADAARLRSMVEHLLALARVGSAEPTAERLDLAAAIREFAEENQLVEVEISTPAPGPVRIPSETFRMILGNLVGNAEQAGATRVRLSLARQWGVVKLLVTDDGPGVSPGNREKIFDPFFTTRRDTGGTGLGLGIVRSLVEAHHGTIELRDSEAGATFAIRFRS